MFRNELGHFEHTDFRLATENSLEVVIGVDHRSGHLILQAVFLDIDPELLGDFGSGQWLRTDHGGQSVADVFFLAVFFLVVFFLAVFFLAVFFLVAFLLVAFFLVVFFLAVFFLAFFLAGIHPSPGYGLEVRLFGFLSINQQPPAHPHHS